MIQETLTEGVFRKTIDDIWTPPTETATDRSKTIAGNRRTELTRLFIDAATNTNIRGTRWAGYQAIIEYLDHAAPVHGKTTADKAINRAMRSIDGSVIGLKERSFATLAT